MQAPERSEQKARQHTDLVLRPMLLDLLDTGRKVGKDDGSAQRKGPIEERRCGKKIAS